MRYALAGEQMAKNEKRHFLVPLHEIVPEDKVPALLKKLNATPKQLPGIKKNDPAIKKLKPKKGSIIRILRESHTAGEAEYYRIVI